MESYVQRSIPVRTAYVTGDKKRIRDFVWGWLKIGHVSVPPQALRELCEPCHICRAWLVQPWVREPYGPGHVSTAAMKASRSAKRSFSVWGGTGQALHHRPAGPSGTLA